MTTLTIRLRKSGLALICLILLSLILLALLPRGTVAQSKDTWEFKIPKTQLGDVYGAVAADGKIYIYRNSFICYDPLTNNSTRTAPLILPFQGTRKGDDIVFNAVALQNRIYVIGGVRSVWQNLDYTFIKIYNISNDSWTNGTDTDYDIEYFPMANVIDGKIYLLDGRSGRLGAFDPSSNSWTTLTALPFWALFTPEQYPLVRYSAVINDRIYFLVEPCDNSPTRMIIYETKSDTWLSAADPPVVDDRGAHEIFVYATTGCFAAQRLYYIGEAAYLHTNLSFNYAYDPTNNSWSTVRPGPISSGGYYANTALNDKLFIFAVNGSAVQVYTPLGYNTAPLPLSPSPNYPQNSPLPKTNPAVYYETIAVTSLVIVSILLVTICLRKLKKKYAAKQSCNNSNWVK